MSIVSKNCLFLGHGLQYQVFFLEMVVLWLQTQL